MSRFLQRVIGVVVACGVAVPLVRAEVLPANASSMQKIVLMRNVSGATQPSGTAYILQDANSDTNVLIGTDFGRESSLGLDVTTTTTDDSQRFVGCQLQDTCLDDALCTVVVWGPAICRWAGSDDNTNNRMATVGTSSIAGNLGSGSNAGLSMSLTLAPGNNDAEQNGTQDNELRWIWVSPDNN